jgi:hypothetical protein
LKRKERRGILGAHRGVRGDRQQFTVARERIGAPGGSHQQSGELAKHFRISRMFRVPRLERRDRIVDAIVLARKIDGVTQTLAIRRSPLCCDLDSRRGWRLDRRFLCAGDFARVYGGLDGGLLRRRRHRRLGNRLLGDGLLRDH